MRKELYNNKGVLISVVDRPLTVDEQERKDAAQPADLSKLDTDTLLRAIAKKINLTAGDIDGTR